MSFSIGIVGLPNVGKSTLFSALTKNTVDAQNYPFCTIDPNVGVVKVPDNRLQKLSDISRSEKLIHNTIEFVDIAGLVKGAHKGEGLGNQFLANIREVDAIAQVVRGFDDPDVIHVHGVSNPQDDIQVINMELILADMATVQKTLDRFKGQMKSSKDKDLQKKYDLFERLLKHLESENLANTFECEEENYLFIKQLNLLTFKPFIYIYNTDEDKLADKVELEGVESNYIIPICAKTESELAELDEHDAQEFLKELGIQQSGLDQVIRAGFEILDLITYFTSGEKETRAWTVKKGSTAPQAAGKIHTDFEKGFIRAEVMAYDDFIEFGGENGCKDAGKLRVEGKTYIVKDGDIMHFRFN